MSTQSSSVDVELEHTDTPLLTSNITKQFLLIAIPTTLGMVINGLYSFVDAIFISKGIGSHAMASVSAVFPIQMLLIAISTMLGSGMASLISRYLGAKRQQDADTVFSASFLLAITISIVLCLLIYFNLVAIFDFLKVPPDLRENATDYITPIVLFWTIGFASNQITEGFRASGNPKAMMQVLSSASILNIILDAVFIFGFGWGVSGAAWATIIAIFMALLFGIKLHNNGESKVSFNKAYLFSPIKIHFKILSLGLPVLMSHGGFSLTLAATVYSISTFFSEQPDTIIAAHGILVRCYMFLFLPIIGMMIALQTLSGFNYGAGQYQRVRSAYLIAICASTLWGLLVTWLLCFNADLLMVLFTSDMEVIELGSDIAKVCFSGFITAGFCMMSSGLFQGMGRALPATFLDAARNYILLFPLMYLLPTYFSNEDLWLAFPIADVVGGIFALGFSLLTLQYLTHREDLPLKHKKFI
ncbi:MATE family efflux transporter [Pseudoalteromonas byunsanensis]|uniref:Multidrug export protein MepA n=1 Tax=Pseudoalteromonas byunsanensis TaxID=327939 RepID=A0A1S1N978_9GAMM|nr:MATE family efflux transporter [Pseudoalteromonas byunsanensis]OHU94820.1 MATE family efflux transporter [Pseudoalteromonas byunsanensis]